MATGFVLFSDIAAHLIVYMQREIAKNAFSRYEMEIRETRGKKGRLKCALFYFQPLSSSSHCGCFRYTLDTLMLVVLDFCLVFEDLAIELVDQAIDRGVQVFRKTFNVYDVSS